MAYRQNNYSFVIDNSFQPFSFQELIQPLALYKDAFEQAEAAYTDLRDKSDTFKYLSSSLPEGSEARQLYEGYANELNKQANDFAKHGLSMMNRRGLTNLRQRYQGEIGRLVKADEALQEEKKLRRTMNAKDSSMLYADDNLNIDQFLDGRTPNLYNISGNELYARGAQAGKAASSRVYSAGDNGKTLGGYYRDYIEQMGYTPEDLKKFGDQITADFSAKVSVLPELQDAANQILEANGANKNLTGDNLRQAQQQVIRGIIDGSVYQESHKQQRDPGVMSAYENATNARAQAQWEQQKQDWEDKRNATYYIDPETKQVTGYKVLPKGKRLDSSGNLVDGDEENDTGSRLSKALLKLNHKDLTNNNGFDVTIDNNRYHYDYAGAIHRRDGTWKAGNLGEWAGLGNNTNVSNSFGLYNLHPDTQYGKDHMRVLSNRELNRWLNSDPSIMAAVDERLKAYGLAHHLTPEETEELDFEIIEIPSETNPEKTGYLVAVKN